jgi:hypothetical protein
MKSSRPTLHLFDGRIAKEKKRLEALVAGLAAGPERDNLLKKITELKTATDIAGWLSSPGLQPPR